MNEIRCPKCGEIFVVDETGYAAIARQIRDSEFSKEVSDREMRIEKEKEDALLLASTNARLEKEKSISELKQEIERYKGLVESGEKDKSLAVNGAVTEQKEVIRKRKADRGASKQVSGNIQRPRTE